MNKLRFNTQKDAINYLGHSWKYILRHYNVTKMYDFQGYQGFLGYCISSK